jgi:hypothetical protein
MREDSSGKRREQTNCRVTGEKITLEELEERIFVYECGHLSFYPRTGRHYCSVTGKDCVYYSPRESD